MLKKLAALLCLLLLLSLAGLCAADEGEVLYAYFKDARWIRTLPEANTPTVINVPERTLLRLTPVSDKYAQTTYQGLTGYIYMKDYVSVAYTDPLSPEAITVEGFFGAPVYMRRSPLKNAPTVALLPTDVRFRITYVTSEYAYLTYEGQEGYVYIADFVEMTYQRGQTEPYIAFCDTATPAYDSPCYGAAVGQVLMPYTPITVDGFDGDHLTILYNDQRLYVQGSEITRLSEDFAVTPFEAQLSAAAALFAYPLENAPTVGTLQKNEKVSVSGYHGQYACVTGAAGTGYIHYSLLKSSAQTTEALSALAAYNKRIEAQRFLNVAFTMLEKNNPVLLSYNENCGGDVVARFEYGCPYLFAGMNESSLLKARYASQNSNYYSTDKRYLGGFDCIGFARWVHNQVGMRKLPAISESKDAGKAYLVDTKKSPSAQWAKYLTVGDCINLAYKSGGYHVMIYIGTLRDFGFTEQQVGALAPYLDNPLVIHCGMNNFHTAWYTQYLKDNHMTSVTPPDGGVTISILGIPYADAPYTETMWKGTKNVKTFYWFDLLGYNLTVVNPDTADYKWFAIYHNSEK